MTINDLTRVGAPAGNRNAKKADPKRVRNRQARISQADTEHFAALGLPRVTAALEALHTGEAIYMLISPEYANAVQAFGQYPTRGGKRDGSGAPIGNSNGRKEIVREISLTMRLSQEEYSAIAVATDGKKLSTWLREIALAAASKEIKNDKI